MRLNNQTVLFHSLLGSNDNSSLSHFFVYMILQFAFLIALVLIMICSNHYTVNLFQSMKQIALVEIMALANIYICEVLFSRCYVKKFACWLWLEPKPKYYYLVSFVYRKPSTSLFKFYNLYLQLLVSCEIYMSNMTPTCFLF